MKILLICGGPSSECEVSINTACEIIKNFPMSQNKLKVMILDKFMNCVIEKAENLKLLNGSIKNKKSFYRMIDKLKDYDLVFNSMHGEFGEDGTLQSILDSCKVRYTGSDSYACRLAMDKYRSSMLVKNIKRVNIPKTVLVSFDQIRDLDMEFPCIIKPNTNGSSIGVKLLRNENHVTTYIDEINGPGGIKDRDFLLQEYISGTEVSCGCLEIRKNKFKELPPIEIVPVKSELFDYNSKYSENAAKEISPPKSISKKLSDEISQISIKIHKLLGCDSYSRSDFIIDKQNRIYYLETNTLPGMTSTSLLPKEASVAGITFKELIDIIINYKI